MPFLYICPSIFSYSLARFKSCLFFKFLSFFFFNKNSAHTGAVYIVSHAEHRQELFILAINFLKKDIFLRILIWISFFLFRNLSYFRTILSISVYSIEVSRFWIFWTWPWSKQFPSHGRTFFLLPRFTLIPVSPFNPSMARWKAHGDTKKSNTKMDLVVIGYGHWRNKHGESS